MQNQLVPLPNTMFLVSILGLIISIMFTISGRLNNTWGFLFVLFFLMLFVASVVSITPQNKEKYKRRK